MIAAHPFGDPQTLGISRDGADPAVVHVTWKVGAADDLTLLGIHLGVLPQDRVLLDGAVSYEPDDGARVQDAPELATYLLDHVAVAVTAGGAACAGEVHAVGDLVADGADIAFTCPQAPDEVTVSASTLTDLHPAYRTLASGPDGQHQVYSLDDGSHAWSLGSGAAPTSTTPTPGGTGAALQIGGVLGAVLLLAAAGALLARRRRRITSHPHPHPHP